MASEYARADTDEVVRRTNLAVQLVNGQIAHSARYAQVQPKICRDGRFPNEFRAPKTVEELRSMDPSSLDRVLGAYQLPTDMRSLRLTSRDTASSKVANLAKLCTLFDFLGASRIADHERLKRNAIMPF
ncbi:hypothetical protein EJ06DRAFT_523136 [Trichodelitschia bisporula]|uniref:Uncharacterized protein n=1 Tax=Trichodelitschia bisporula TaxID=703511 RepID=A0A6G1HQT9_9PEZI|nr:hypothetical protein EJ06DRAFT_523136 [Trichodelitschia bisporula]